ncbi:MAG TPA: DNA mismatch repair protein MutS [Pyrinomonadaceae bacterium]|jgi:DNA mismatch repair protein MutS|nr:DNA mismatch repair protein MutS [Pyrinomonadaceae bacterium]
MTATTPLYKQYQEIKQRHRDAILLFRIGDFYETFDDDARLVARELDIVLTSKPMGKNIRVPLAGVPYHSLERHLSTLIGRGHRVAICEQLSSAPVKGEAGRGLIERDVVRIVTPGTVIEPGLLQSKANNYLAAYVREGTRAGIAYADVTTGEFAATELEGEAAVTELQRIAPSELLLPASLAHDDDDGAALPGFITRVADRHFEFANARRTLLEHFQTRSLVPLGLIRWSLAASAAGALIAYLRDTQAQATGQLMRLSSYHIEGFMMLDAQTMRSLEIFESGVAGGPTLLSVLDRTRTAMGGRRLRRWLRQPLLDAAELVRRQEHVAWLIEHSRNRAELCAALENIHDLERLSSRARASIASAQEVQALAQSLEALPRVRAVLQRDAKRFTAALAALPLCEATAKLIRRAVSDELPRSKNTGLIREGFSAELDELRALLRNGKTYLAEMEQRERARTGIKSLRVGYNKVFGHYIEVTRPNLHLVPEEYRRKQTLTNAERFITLELKEHESLVVNAQERISELEASLFRHLCVEVCKNRTEILSAADTIAYLDAVASFAEVAEAYAYVRPELVDSPELRIRDGRHPVLERSIEAGAFVANDAELGGDDKAPQVALITGPNMSGKSTYLRQTALIVLMAQTGSFVPAASATVGLCDRIFTRIGLYDRIGAGESTFMTEMIETAQILHHASPRSLILLDELGRGTSTYDGLAVARAVLEYIHNHPQIHSKTLFATHYHELTELAHVLPRLRNLHVEIAEEGSELSFLYKISPGIALKSYGVYAAKLAGLPRPVVRRAEELLGEYESQADARDGAGKGTQGLGGATHASTHETKLAQALVNIDLDTLSPVEALMKLYELRRLADAEKAVRVVKTA